MPEQARSTGPTQTVGRTDGESALVEEIAQQKEEILRLRDLLIAKDAELGAARGKLTELTEHSARFAIAARSMQSRVPGLLRRALAGLRRRG